MRQSAVASLVPWPQISRIQKDRTVPGEALGEADVLGLAAEVCATKC
jgi:hypothetical protein